MQCVLDVDLNKSRNAFIVFSEEKIDLQSISYIRFWKKNVMYKYLILSMVIGASYSKICNCWYKQHGNMFPLNCMNILGGKILSAKSCQTVLIEFNSFGILWNVYQLLVDNVCLTCISKYTYAGVLLLHCATSYTGSCDTMENMMSVMSGDSWSKTYFGHLVIYFFSPHKKEKVLSNSSQFKSVWFEC